MPEKMINRAQEGGSHQTGDSLSHTAGRPSKKAKVRIIGRESSKTITDLNNF